MKKTRSIFFAILSTLVVTTELFAQTDEEQIAANRMASNLALKSYDTEKVLSYLTVDALTTTGNGTLLCGKEALAKYISDGGKSKMYWIRETKEIRVNTILGLAWESGIWKGYDPEQSSTAIVKGNYSAMWTKDSGIWKIKTQLFVTLTPN